MSCKMNGWLLFVTIALGPFLVGIDFLAIGIAVDPIAGYFNTPLNTMHWFVSAYAIGCSSFLIVAGEFVDRFGGKRIFQIGLVLFFLSSLLIAYSPTIWHAITGRLLQGISGGLLTTSSTAVIVQYYDKSSRNKWLARLIGAAGLGMVVGPTVGGYLIKQFSWQALFLINIPIAALSFFLCSLFMNKRINQAKRTNRVDLSAVILIMLTMAFFTNSLTQIQHHSWHSMPLLLNSFTFIVLSSLLFFNQKRSQQPIIDIMLLRSRNLLPASAIAFICYFSVIAWLFIWGLYFHRALHLNSFIAGMHFLPFSLAMLLTCALIPRMQRFTTNKQLMLTGGLLLTIGFIGLSMQSLELNWISINLFFMLIGIGFALTNSSSMPIALYFVKESKLGLASGKTMMFRWLGGAIGATIAAIFVSSFTSNAITGTTVKPIAVNYQACISQFMILLAIICLLTFIPFSRFIHNEKSN